MNKKIIFTFSLCFVSLLAAENKISKPELKKTVAYKTVNKNKTNCAQQLVDACASSNPQQWEETCKECCDIFDYIKGERIALEKGDLEIIEQLERKRIELEKKFYEKYGIKESFFFVSGCFLTSFVLLSIGAYHNIEIKIGSQN